MRWLLSRISLRGVLAALPLVVVGVLFAARLRPRSEIEMALFFEIQVVLMFPLVIVPVRARPRHWLGHVARWVALVGVLLLFLGKGAYMQGGLAGVATMLVLMLATYSGALFGPDVERRFPRMLARFLVGFGSIIGSCVLSGVCLGWDNNAVRDSWWGAFCMFMLAIGELVLSSPAPRAARSATVVVPSDAPRNEIIARREEHAARLRAFAEQQESARRP